MIFFCIVLFGLLLNGVDCKLVTFYVTPNGQGDCASSSSRCTLTAVLKKINTEGKTEVKVDAATGQYDITEDSPVLPCSTFSLDGEGSVDEVVITLNNQKNPFLRFEKSVVVEISKITFSGVERTILTSSNQPIQLTLTEINFNNGNYPLINQRSGLSQLHFQTVNVNDWSNGFITIERNEVDLSITSTLLQFTNLLKTSPIQIYSSQNSIEGTFSQLKIENSQKVFHPGSGLGFYAKDVTVTLSQATIMNNYMVPIHLNGSGSVDLTIKDSSDFYSNYGFFGGAIWLESREGQVTLDISDSTFKRNLAQFMGATIRILSKKPVMYTSKKNVFSENHSYDSGGAVYIEQTLVGVNNLGTSQIDIQGDTYDGHYSEIGHGGVFWIYTALLDLTVNNTYFSNNEAGKPMLERGQKPGGVFKISTFSSMNIEIHKSTFFKNTGQEGGVFYLDNFGASNVLKVFDSNFTQNRAYDEDCEEICQTGRGGVFFLMFMQPVVSNTTPSVQLEIQDSHFEKNSALWNGGVVYIFENEESYSLYNVILVNNDFLQNTAWGSGGAGFFYMANGVLNNNRFVKNVIGTSLKGRYIADGGGLNWEGGSSLVVGQGNVWEGNVASHYGGGLALKDLVSIDFHSDDIVVENNEAFGGGGMYLKNTRATLTCKVNDNKADYGGGLVIDLPSPNDALTLHNEVTGNRNGGIYIVSSNGVTRSNLEKYVKGNTGASNLMSQPLYVEQIVVGGDAKKDNFCGYGGKDNYFWNCQISVLRFIDEFGDVLAGQTMSSFTLILHIEYFNDEMKKNIIVASIPVSSTDTQTLSFSYLPQTGDEKGLSGMYNAIVEFNGRKDVIIEMYFDNGPHHEEKKKSYMWILYLCLVILLVVVYICCLCCLTAVVLINLLVKVRKSYLNFDYKQIQEEQDEDQEKEPLRLTRDDEEEEETSIQIIGEEIGGEYGYQSL